MFDAGISEKNNPKLGFVVFINASLSDGVYIRFIFLGRRVYTLVQVQSLLRWPRSSSDDCLEPQRELLPNPVLEDQLWPKPITVIRTFLCGSLPPPRCTPAW